MSDAKVLTRYYVPDNCLDREPEKNEVTGEVYPHYEVVLASDYATLRSQCDALAEALRDVVVGFERCMRVAKIGNEFIDIKLSAARQALAAAPEAGKP